MQLALLLIVTLEHAVRTLLPKKRLIGLFF